MTRTILVSNRLPVRARPDGTLERTTGGLASALSGAGVDAVWVGWPGLPAEAIPDRDVVSAQLREIGVAPVLLTQHELDTYYEGYANATLWPLLHSMATRAVFRADWSSVYRDVNHRFADAVLAVAAPGDTVWIHDFHLFLLPELLRAAGRDLRIGFFLHTPFPSSDLFRILPERREVLNGVLGADRIGFHTFGYLRHFRSAVLRVLGIESDVDSVRRVAHTAHLGVHPIGHDQQSFAKALASPAFGAAMAAHTTNLGDRRLVLGVERLDYTKGVPQKLEVIRRFLHDHPEQRRSVLFLLIAVPSRQGIREYDELTEEVQRTVGALNGQYGSIGNVPIEFLHQSFPQEELAALYALADVCQVTPLVDGMNLVAKEFVACKVGSPAARPGALVLSEFAGAAAEMSEALLVNPYDVEASVETLVEALAMADEERVRRMQSMGRRVQRLHAGTWAAEFLDALTAPPRPTSGTDDLPGLEGLAERWAAELRAGRSAMLLLDYDGTLRGFTAVPDEALPDEELRRLLAALSAIPNVTVAVVSGRSKDFLEQHLSGLGLALVAEHGFRWRLADEEDFVLVHPGVDLGWMDSVMPPMQQAVDQTPGSSLEIKQSSLVWHYRRAEPEYGVWRAHLLLTELTDVTANLPVVVHHGKKIVEVASQMVSKGRAVTRLLEQRAPDLVLLAGDDQTDETMFAVDHTLRGRATSEFVTVKIGDGPTRAHHRTDGDGLRAFLRELVRSATSA
ncbi:MAG: bifunctional alpha,alpha-trehalose-phosphate synthase (UDP-forming)/trehalose-phosphatase [Planctomycetes bacterium]|nr:bifunctional alpha,alpha-trehalose-phosphate synthase (UDP-forming)/trehalose-phosphatase [Planctomycetota bacterium]